MRGKTEIAHVRDVVARMDSTTLCIDDIKTNMKTLMNTANKVIYGLTDVAGAHTRSQTVRLQRIQDLTTQNDALLAENEKYKGMVAKEAHDKFIAQAQLAMAKSENNRLQCELSRLRPHVRKCGDCGRPGHDTRTCPY